MVHHLLSIYWVRVRNQIWLMIMPHLKKIRRNAYMEATEFLTSILDIFYYYRPGGQSTFLFEKPEIYDRYLVRYSFIGNAGASQLINRHPTNQRIHTHRTCFNGKELCPERSLI